MDNAWVVPTFALIVVYALVGSVFGIFWVMTRYVFRLARKYWQLPPKTWTILTIGLIMQALCVVILIGAIYVSFLPQQPFKPLYEALLALGVAGVSLSCAVLALWLALVIRAQRHISPLAAIFGRNRKNRNLVILFTAATPFLAFGQMAEPDHFHSWPLGIFVALPFTLYMLCLTSLIRHSSEDLAA